MAAGKTWTDQRMEDVIGKLLRAGVLLSALVVLVGGGIYLAHYGLTLATFRVFHGEPTAYRTLHGILREAFSGHGRGIIQLGLLLLIATPVARVAFAVWGFWEERDRMYVIFTLIVLAILLYSLLGSGIGS